MRKFLGVIIIIWLLHPSNYHGANRNEYGSHGNTLDQSPVVQQTNIDQYVYHENFTNSTFKDKVHTTTEGWPGKPYNPKNFNLGLDEIEIADEGKKLHQTINGEFKIVIETEGNFTNFVHLWFHSTGKLYIGYLHKVNGKFKLKEENISKIEKLGIKEGIHFKVVDNSADRSIEQSMIKLASE